MTLQGLWPTSIPVYIFSTIDVDRDSACCRRLFVWLGQAGEPSDRCQLLLVQFVTRVTQSDPDPDPNDPHPQITLMVLPFQKRTPSDYPETKSSTSSSKEHHHWITLWALPAPKEVPSSKENHQFQRRTPLDNPEGTTSYKRTPRIALNALTDPKEIPFSLICTKVELLNRNNQTRDKY